MLLVDILGYVGAVFVFFLTYPQVYHCFRYQTTKGLSPWFIFFEFMASICFTLYGIYLPSTPIIVANTSALFGSLLLILAKIKYPEQDSEFDPSETEVAEV